MSNEKIRLVLREPQTFKDALTSISGIIDEANIIIKPTHIEIMSMDAANVAMVVFKMLKTEFSEYEAGENEGTIGIKLRELKTILSRGNKDSAVTITVENNKLVASFDGKTKKKFTLPLIELENKATKIPSLSFNAEITMDNADLKEAIADASIAGEGAEFRVDTDKLVITGTGDMNKAVTELNVSINKLNEDESCSKYNIEYLNHMTSTKLSKNVKISLAKDYPLKLSYVNEKGTTSIDYVLAPRVNND